MTAATDQVLLNTIRRWLDGIVAGELLQAPAYSSNCWIYAMAEVCAEIAAGLPAPGGGR
jgi:hypothetical protein